MNVVNCALTLRANSQKAQDGDDGNVEVPHDDCKAVVARLTTPRCSPIPRSPPPHRRRIAEAGAAAVNINDNGSYRGDFEVVSIIAWRRGGVGEGGKEGGRGELNVAGDK